MRVMDAHNSQDVPSRGLESWIDAARRGDREALGRALLAFRRYLLLIANEGLDPELAAKGGASDIVQDAMLRAHRSFRDFRGRSTVEWRGWLRAILLTRLAQHRRAFCLTAKRQQSLEVAPSSLEAWPLISPEPSPSEVLLRHERESTIRAAVDRLPAHYREVVLEHQRDRLAFDEIGRRRGISDEAARKLWTRAIVRLRREMGPTHGSG